jgi:hypothetical protein
MARLGHFGLRDDAWANTESLVERDHPKYRAIVDFTGALGEGFAR